ncbi:hypothetical protein LINGRAHAP2_LOCUS4985, partial [Linum grandiflorum]
MEEAMLAVKPKVGEIEGEGIFPSAASLVRGGVGAGNEGSKERVGGNVRNQRGDDNVEEELVGALLTFGKDLLLRVVVERARDQYDSNRGSFGVRIRRSKKLGGRRSYRWNL